MSDQGTGGPAGWPSPGGGYAPPGGGYAPPGGGYAPPGGGYAPPGGGYAQAGGGYAQAGGGYAVAAGAPQPWGAVPSRPALASWGRRLAAWLIDWVLLAVVDLAVGAATGTAHFHSSSGAAGSSGGVSVGGAGVALQVALVLAYGALLCGSRRGQTVGMMALGVRVVRASDGAPLGFAKALGRGAFEYLLVVALFVPWVIDMLSPLWDSSNQTWHDKVVGAVVVRT